MKHIECEQGSPEWWAAKRGILSASVMDKVLTPQLKLSASRTDIMYKLLAERASGMTDPSFESDYMKRGKDVEGEARDYYAMMRGVEVAQAGFITLDDGSFGVSADGLIGEEGGLEIKCPSSGVHYSYLLRGTVPSYYLMQPISSLYCTGRKWWDWMSYHPGLPPLIVRIDREEVKKEISVIAIAISEFDKQMRAAEKMFNEKYFDF